MDQPEDNVTLPNKKRGVFKDRRKNSQDRRRSVREGIFVSLSVTKDRRVLKDRRRTSP
jgi:hypothetical protein